MRTINFFVYINEKSETKFDHLMKSIFTMNYHTPEHPTVEYKRFA